MGTVILSSSAPRTTKEKAKGDGRKGKKGRRGRKGSSFQSAAVTGEAVCTANCQWKEEEEAEEVE